MKCVIFSDVHGNAKAMRTFSKGMTRFQSDAIICLGDIVHNKSSYENDQVIELAKQLHGFNCISGNHDREVREALLAEIAPQTAQFLNWLPDTLQLQREGLLFSHSLMTFPLKRDITKEEIGQEAKHIMSTYPWAKLVFFGHTHCANVAHYSPNSKKVSERLRLNEQTDHNAIPLKEQGIYFINPGALGTTQPNTFAVLDTEKKQLRYYNLNQLEDMATRASLVFAFEEEWMPHLTGDEQSWKDLSDERQKVVRANRCARFDRLETILAQFNSRHDSKKEAKKRYYGRFSAELAQALNDLITRDVLENYLPPDCLPFATRQFYLGRKYAPIRGVRVSTGILTSPHSSC